MNENEEEIMIEPITCISLYKVKEAQYGSGLNVITLKHPIEPNGKGGVSIGAGTPTELTKVIEALQSLETGKINSPLMGFIPEGVFYRMGAWSGWEVPARPAVINFKSRSVMLPMPRMLLFSNGKELRVCAIQGKVKISPRTKVFHAPLMNVYSNGNVCWGSVKKPESHPDEIQMKAWETALLEGISTHVNHDHTLKLEGMEKVDTATHTLFMLELAKQKQFPDKHLHPMKCGTLENFIKSFIEGNKHVQ